MFLPEVAIYYASTYFGLDEALENEIKACPYFKKWRKNEDIHA